MRLVVKFGDKKRYSDSEYDAIYEELVVAGLDDEARRDPDAIEAVYKKLNAVDEAELARRDLCGSPRPWHRGRSGFMYSHFEA